MGRDWARLVNWVRRAQIRRAARYPFHGLPTKKHHHHISPPERCSKQFAAKHGKKLQKSPAQKAKEEEGGAPFATLAQNITHLLVPYARPRQPTTQNPPASFFRRRRRLALAESGAQTRLASFARNAGGRILPFSYFKLLGALIPSKKNNFRKTIRI